MKTGVSSRSFLQIRSPLTIKSFAFISTVLLAGITSVRAHGHIVSWVVNGESKPGFNPYWTSELGPTAERPTDNVDEGEKSATRTILTFRLGRLLESHRSVRGLVCSFQCPDMGCPGRKHGHCQLGRMGLGTSRWVLCSDTARIADIVGPVLEYMAACPASEYCKMRKTRTRN